ncbi:MAG: AAA family ATPase [Methylacidiphilales bacterium]|nr:AAA family ATPase [Candidatus Methylacidiphilales bacterium]
MSTWLIPRNELTLEQLRAIDLPHTEHQVIFGAPGSGKTQILLHRAVELRRRLGSTDGRFRILVFTGVLKNYLRSALELLGLPEQVVSTFDDWCKGFYERHINSRVPWDAVAKRPDFEAIRTAVAQRIASGTVRLPLYDFVLVDEGQDLESANFDMLRRIAGHVTVCLDHKQQIYERGCCETEILNALGLRRRNMTLLDAYRCSPFVARLAAQFLQEAAEREQYLRQVRTEQRERELPLLYEAASFQDEKRRLTEVLRQRLLTDQRVAVLFPLRRQVFGFAKGLAAAGIEVETQENLDFGSSRPKLITYHSAKGLTFDSVLLPRLVAESFPRTTDARQRRLLFVAVTRATRWVYMSTVVGDSIPLLADLKRMEAERGLTIQRFEHASVQSAPPESSERESSGLDFL